MVRYYFTQLCNSQMVFSVTLVSEKSHLIGDSLKLAYRSKCLREPQGTFEFTIYANFDGNRGKVCQVLTYIPTNTNKVCQGKWQHKLHTYARQQCGVNSTQFVVNIIETFADSMLPATIPSKTEQFANRCVLRQKSDDPF